MPNYFATLSPQEIKEVSARGNAVRKLQVANRNSLIKQDYEQGYAPRVLALKYKLSLVQIYRIIK